MRATTEPGRGVDDVDGVGGGVGGVEQRPVGQEGDGVRVGALVVVVADLGGLHVEVGRPTRGRGWFRRRAGGGGRVAAPPLAGPAVGMRAGIAAPGRAERRQAHRLERLLDRPLDHGIGREVGRGLADGLGRQGERDRRGQELGERAVEYLPDELAMGGAGPGDPRPGAPVRAALDGEVERVAEDCRVAVAAVPAAVARRLEEPAVLEGEARIVPGPVVAGECELRAEGIGAGGALRPRVREGGRVPFAVARRSAACRRAACRRAHAGAEDAARYAEDGEQGVDHGSALGRGQDEPPVVAQGRKRPPHAPDPYRQAGGLASVGAARMVGEPPRTEPRAGPEVGGAPGGGAGIRPCEHGRGEGVERRDETAPHGVGEVKAAAFRDGAVRERVRAVGPRQDDQPRRSGRRLAGRAGDVRNGLGLRQHRRRLHLDAAMQRAEQRHRHAALELPRHPGAVHRYPGHVLDEMFVGAFGQGAVAAAGRHDELAGPYPVVDGRVPLPQLADGGRVADRHGEGVGGPLGGALTARGHERRPDHRRRDRESWSGSHSLPSRAPARARAARHPECAGMALSLPRRPREHDSESIVRPPRGPTTHPTSRLPGGATTISEARPSRGPRTERPGGRAGWSIDGF